MRSLNKGLYLTNLIAIDNEIIKPSTMSDKAVFVCFGDDGGFTQSIIRAYQKYGSSMGVVLRDVNIPEFDIDKMSQRLPDITNLNDCIIDLQKQEDEKLQKLCNNLEGLNEDVLDDINSLIMSEAFNGASLFIASKELPFVNLFHQEIEFKPYFLFYAIAGLLFLEKNGTMVIKIYDTNTEFTRTLIYFLSCNFTSTTIMKPYSMNSLLTERLLVCRGMIHKDIKSEEKVNQLKQVFKLLKSMHLDKSSDLSTFLIESDDSKIGVKIKQQEKFLKYFSSTQKEMFSKVNDFITSMNTGNRFLRAIKEYKEQAKAEDSEAQTIETEFSLKLNKALTKFNCLKLWNIEMINTEENKQIRPTDVTDKESAELFNMRKTDIAKRVVTDKPLASEEGVK